MAPSSDTPSSPIATLQAKLIRYPHVRYRIAANRIVIAPVDAHGFEVQLVDAGAQWLVQFEGWHESFEAAADALECAALGLSDACRLAIELRGRCACKWTLQVRAGDGWRSISTVGLLLVPFWRPRTVVYRQNRVLLAA
jgi:hypothetical protein